MSSSRYYTIRLKQTGDIVRLVDAKSRDGAIAHVARSMFEASVATPQDVLRAMQANVQPEKAGEAPVEHSQD